MPDSRGRAFLLGNKIGLIEMKRVIIYLMLLAMPAGVWAQEAAVKKIMEMAREDNRTMQHLDILCNRIGGRPAGSDACANAEQWVARSFREWGLEVSIEKAGELGVGFNRGGWWGRMMGEESMTLHFATPSYSSGTKGPQKGHVVVEPRTQEEFNRMRGLLRGAWVLVNGRSGGWGISHGEKATENRHRIIEANAEAAKFNREQAGQDGERKKIDETTPALFYDEMVQAGVLGFIQAAEVPIRSLYDRNVVLDGTATFDNLPAVPNILLDEEQYYRIRTLAEQRRQIELEFDIRNYFKIGPVAYNNIVAKIEGKKYPNEYVVVGAHLDAFDTATGGVDCGSGVSAVMEAARMIMASGAKPDRTILFVIFAAEEFGLLGSQAWVKAHQDMLPKISNMFNRDGGPLPYTSFSVPQSLLKNYEKVVEPIHELYPDYNFTLDAIKPFKKPTQLGGNDASTFSVAGIPAVQMADWADPKGYNFSYHEIWHTERDTFRKSIPEYQEQAAVTMALMVLGTANMPKQWPREEVFSAE